MIANSGYFRVVDLSWTSAFLLRADEWETSLAMTGLAVGYSTEQNSLDLG
jgi:hypothetical protein